MRVRSSAPHVIARGGLRLLRSGDTDRALNLYLCTGCQGCEQACPLDNPLPDAIRRARSRINKPPKPEAKPLHVGGMGEERILLLSPVKPPLGVVEALASRRYSVYWLDSTSYTMAYWSGVEEFIDVEGFNEVVIEDFDAPVKGAALNGLELIKKAGVGLKRELEEYILHVPCKARGGTEDLAVELLGRPSRVLSTCSGGGGGMLHYMEDYSVEMAGIVAGSGPVVTLCRWSQLAFEKAGLRAYTVLDLV